MCCRSCRDTSEPSEIPSSTSTAWVRIGGIASGRPAIAAMPTAIMAPEINPPGRLSRRNSAPPAVPMASVSSTWRVLARLGRANAVDAGIWLTPPYGKSLHGGQLRQRDCSNALAVSPSVPWTRAEGERSLRLVGRGLLAFGTEFLALLAVKSLGVGLLGAFERRRGPRRLSNAPRRPTPRDFTARSARNSVPNARRPRPTRRSDLSPSALVQGTEGETANALLQSRWRNCPPCRDLP